MIRPVILDSSSLREAELVLKVVGNEGRHLTVFIMQVGLESILTGLMKLLSSTGT